MNYCPECGCALELRQRHDRSRLCCPNCSFVHYGRFTVGVGGLVVDDGRMLLVHRRFSRGPGLWAIPNGYAEQDERLDAAVVREVREETGVETAVEGVVGVRSRVLETEHSLYILLKLRWTGGVPQPDGIEVDDARFVPLAEVLLIPDVQPFTRWLARQLQQRDLPVFTEAVVEGMSSDTWVYYG